MHITRAFSFVLLAISAGACSSSSGSKAAPVLTSYDANDTATASVVDGVSAYTITGNLQFSDSAEDVVSLTTHLEPSSGEPTIADADTSFPQPAANGPYQLNLYLPADPKGQSGLAPGSVTYTITLHSASGISSAPLTKTITLQ